MLYNFGSIWSVLFVLDYL